jgi:large conductance mechanosensitive channel
MLGDKMWKEFKKFAMRGNIMDLAIGIVVGGAFASIVNSLVNDLIMPLLGLLIGRINLANLFIQLGGDEKYRTLRAARANGVLTINYGLFINSIINFLIISFSIFLVIRQINRWRDRLDTNQSKEVKKKCPYCFSDVHVEAIKCPQCTSILKDEQVRINIKS